MHQIKFIEMRKILVLAALAGLLITTGTGCLKDKKFEDNEYGIQIKDEKAVAFAQASASPVVIGINSQTAPIIVDGPYITLEQGGVAATDVHVKLTIDNSLVTAAGLTPLDVTEYSVSTLDVTIPAGQKLTDVVKITVNNSSILDATESYGIGFTISTVDQGYKIAANQKNVVISFNIKNKYDGKYKAKGYGFLGTTNTTAPFLFNVECSWDLNLITSGANSVYMDAQPLFRGGSIIAFGNVFPKFIFDVNTDKVIGMANDAPGNGIAMNFPIDGGTYDSRFDPATRTIYVKFGLNNSATWRVIDTLEYCGPR
jgi:hypothetical protein